VLWVSAFGDSSDYLRWIRGFSGPAGRDRTGSKQDKCRCE
jgi:hypothetical protein